MHNYGSHGIQPKRWFVQDKEKIIIKQKQPPSGASCFSEETKKWIWSKIEIGKEDECWPCYTGLNENGYPRIRVCGVLFKGHRLVYAISIGEIPEGLLLCHKCDNPTCCNPNHMFIGTQRDNTQDAMIKGRLATGENHGTNPNRPKKQKFKNPKLAKKTGEHGVAVKFSNEQIAEVKRLFFTENLTQASIARAISMSPSHVWGIVRGKCKR